MKYLTISNFEKHLGKHQRFLALYHLKPSHRVLQHTVDDQRYIRNGLAGTLYIAHAAL